MGTTKRARVHIVFIGLALFWPTWQFGQSGFGYALECQDNANWEGVSSVGRSDIISASFKISTSSGNSCTGTLINRAVDQDVLGFYFVTARHCWFNPNVDFEQEQYLMFNYQSPTEANLSTPFSNQGRVRESSISLNPPPGNPDNPRGYEYLHKTKLRMVREVFWGDFALLEILTPLPPHFNVYFAGWNPSGFLSDGISFGNTVPCNLINRFALAHHPRADIKKISGTNVVANPPNPVYVICDVVTTVIDALFGWIWGNSSSTQVICNYVDVPWYVVGNWCEGGSENGSSGAGLMNPNNRFIGPLSGGLGHCQGVSLTTFGKFKNLYPIASIKNTLNPSNDWWTDQSGIYGRRVSCYTNLTLPGGHQEHTYYFPANHYQPENRITLRAQDRIQVAAPITILEGAHYEFKAGASIELNGLVEVRPGATFVAEIEGCTKSLATNGAYDVNMTEFVKFPLRKEIDMDGLKLVQETESEPRQFLDVFPNPATEILRFRTDMVGPFNMQLLAGDGRVVSNGSLGITEYDISGLSQGIYMLHITGSSGELRIARFIKE